MAARTGAGRGPERPPALQSLSMADGAVETAWIGRGRAGLLRRSRGGRRVCHRSTAGGAGVVEPRPRGRLARLAGERSPTGERTGPSPWPAPGGPPAIETGGRLFGAADLAAVLATRGRRRVRDGRPRDRPRRSARATRRGLPAPGSRRGPQGGGPRSRPPAGPGNRRYPAPGVESDAQLRRAWGRTVRKPRSRLAGRATRARVTGGVASEPASPASGSRPAAVRGSGSGAASSPPASDGAGGAAASSPTRSPSVGCPRRRERGSSSSWPGCGGAR